MAQRVSRTAALARVAGDPSARVSGAAALVFARPDTSARVSAQTVLVFKGSEGMLVSRLAVLAFVPSVAATGRRSFAAVLG